MKHLEQLTWLRGFAAVLVIISHSLRSTEVKYFPSDTEAFFLPINLFDLGSFGVTLFFALSGCTLYLSNAKKLNIYNVLNFYIKRLLRIWPAFFFSLLIYIAFIPIFIKYYGSAQNHWIEDQFLIEYTFSDVINYLFLIFNFTGPDNLFNGAYWSLPIEFQYYLIFPLLILFFRLYGWIGPMLIGILMFIIPNFYSINMRTELFNLAFVFCGGVIIAYIYKNTNRRLSMIQGIPILIIIILIVSGFRNYYITLPELFSNYSGKWTWYGLLSLMLVFTTILTKFKLHNIVERYLTYYGEISYGTYLYHNLFIGISILIIKTFELYSGNSKLWFVLIFTIIFTQLLAGISYKYLEVPFIRLGKKITMNFRN